MQKGLLYNMLLRLGKCFFLFPLFFIACDDLEDKPSIVPKAMGMYSKPEQRRCTY